MEARISQDEFLCPVCLDLLKDPVTISCGHSFCWSCIRQCWNLQDESEIYSCPQCRETFYRRPALAKSTILAEMLEKLKNKPSADRHAGDGDVPCDACPGRKYKAVKSCVECQESYCLSHLERHEEFHSRKRHRMIEATDELPLEDLHWTKTQKKLMVTQREFQQKILQQEKDLQQLRDSVESHERSAMKAVEDTEKILAEMIQSIQRKRDEVKQLIRDQEETAVSEAEGIMEKLQQDIEDLKRKDEKIEELLQTLDDISSIQSSPSLSTPLQSADVRFSSLSLFKDVTKSVPQLIKKLEEFCNNVMKLIHDKLTVDNIDLWSRSDFLHYSCQFTLDLNTMSEELCLSEGNTVTYTDTFQSYPDHPDRFECVPQILFQESVSGRCYWELEWTGVCVYISVSYKSISREGRSDDCCFGCNNQSWSLICLSSGFMFRHNNVKTDLSVSISRRVGVFVDHDGGILSFYSVSDTMTLIHRVQTTFTQPLCPGVYVGHSSCVKVCDTSEYNVNPVCAGSISL